MVLSFQRRPLPSLKVSSSPLSNGSSPPSTDLANDWHRVTSKLQLVALRRPIIAGVIVSSVETLLDNLLQ